MKCPSLRRSYVSTVVLLSWFCYAIFEYRALWSWNVLAGLVCCASGESNHRPLYQEKYDMTSMVKSSQSRYQSAFLNSLPISTHHPCHLQLNFPFIHPSIHPLYQITSNHHPSPHPRIHRQPLPHLQIHAPLQNLLQSQQLRHTFIHTLDFRPVLHSYRGLEYV